jgi:hypothetical protein
MKSKRVTLAAAAFALTLTAIPVQPVEANVRNPFLINRVLATCVRNSPQCSFVVEILRFLGF